MKGKQKKYGLKGTTGISVTATSKVEALAKIKKHIPTAKMVDVYIR